MRTILIFLAINLLICSFSGAEDYYYYSSGEKQYLTQTDSKILIGLEPEGYSSMYTFLQNHSDYADTIAPQELSENCFILCTRPGLDLDSLIDTLKSESEVAVIQHVFINETGEPRLLEI